MPIAKGQVAVFWAIMSHRIVRVDEPVLLLWLTLPLARILLSSSPERAGSFEPGEHRKTSRRTLTGLSVGCILYAHVRRGEHTRN